MMDARKIASAAGKAATVAVAGAMVLAMTACGGKKEETKSDDSEKTTEVSPADTDGGQAEQASDATATSATTPAETAGTTQAAGAAYAYDYTPGTLNSVMTPDGTAPAVPDFAITGMILVGNQQETGSVDALMAEGYKTTGLASDFRLNEWIEFYLDDASIAQLGTGMKIVAVPHGDAAAYAGIAADELALTAENSGGFVLDVAPDAVEQVNGFNRVASGYVNMDLGTPGLWDILFLKDGRVAQYVCVNMAPSL